MLYIARVAVDDGSAHVNYLYPKTVLVVSPCPCSQNVTGQVVSLHISHPPELAWPAVPPSATTDCGECLCCHPALKETRRFHALYARRVTLNY